jgi:hypothetical protein
MMQRQCKTIFNNQINPYSYVGRCDSNDDLAIEINKTFGSIEQDPNVLDLNLYPLLQLSFEVENNFDDELTHDLLGNFYSKVLEKRSAIISFYEKYFDELGQMRDHLFLEMSLHIEDEWGPDDAWCLCPDGTVILFNDGEYNHENTLYIKAAYFDEFKKDCLNLYIELR